MPAKKVRPKVLDDYREAHGACKEAEATMKELKPEAIAAQELFNDELFRVVNKSSTGINGELAREWAEKNLTGDEYKSLIKIEEVFDVNKFALKFQALPKKLQKTLPEGTITTKSWKELHVLQPKVTKEKA